MYLKEILKKIKEAELNFARPIGSTKLIAVSKVQPIERVVKVLDQGHRSFGENRIQEAHSKWPDLKINMMAWNYTLLGRYKQIKLELQWN